MGRTEVFTSNGICGVCRLYRRYIYRKYRTSSKKTCKIAFIITVILVVSNLFIFKYLNFFAGNLGLIFGKSWVIDWLVLPIGISFYTFQILSYVIDLYSGKIKIQKNFCYLLLYVSLFPQLIAGPIVRYETIENKILNRRETVDDAVAGFKRFIIGLAKKVILANNLGLLADMILTGSQAVYGNTFYWIGALSYALQIYFDFSGYSDMAIGLGRVFGFHFLEDFNYPYVSLSITEFWRRWHISLSSWFRDYIYIPLGGNRKGVKRQLLNIFIVWALTGFWHGANWNFIIWGIFYALLLIIEKTFVLKYIDKIPKIIRYVVTMFLVVIGWTIFYYTDVTKLLSAIKNMFSFALPNLATVYAENAEILWALFYVPLGIICMLPIKNKINLHKYKGGATVTAVAYILLLAVSIIFMFGLKYNPFIYFRF